MLEITTPRVHAHTSRNTTLREVVSGVRGNVGLRRYSWSCGWGNCAKMASTDVTWRFTSYGYNEWNKKRENVFGKLTWYSPLTFASFHQANTGYTSPKHTIQTKTHHTDQDTPYRTKHITPYRTKHTTHRLRLYSHEYPDPTWSKIHFSFLKRMFKNSPS